ncbi:MAG: (Fe-S)-binding protein [Actinomycetaceae bacterium]|nr:(Fe-S)-binding protein [Actinomycetaceae bacterium]MDU0969635.1 (Fe-S)-binding protein [Actinomycetaceae bacterium]
MRVALFATCINDAMFPQAAIATTHLLRRLGISVDFPRQQACCGQMHVNTGYYPEALRLTRNHVRTFEPVLDGRWDAIVVPSSSCTGSIREQQALVARDAGENALADAVEAIAAKTYDLSEFLCDVYGSVDLGSYFPHKATYHSTCHSMRITKVGDRPYRLLRAVEGLELIDLPQNTSCCGFGGTFSMKNIETSKAMLMDKMTNIKSTGAEVVIAGDYSCLMHIGGGLSKANAGIRAIHLAEVLAPTKDEQWVAPTWTTKVGAR